METPFKLSTAIFFLCQSEKHKVTLGKKKILGEWELDSTQRTEGAKSDHENKRPKENEGKVSLPRKEKGI